MAKSKSKSGSKSKPKATSAPNGNRDAATLTRIADALERLAPGPNADSNFAAADAFIWQAQNSRQGSRLVPVPRVNRVEMTLLKGIDRVRDTLMENTERFAKGLPANNARLNTTTIGAVALNVNGPVTVSANGLGTVAVTGRPVCTVRGPGAGQVRCGVEVPR
jgi:hypothetical protein